jgi:hypothetical protein
VTGDHGEAFGEHGDRWHGSNLHDPQLRPGALLRVPGVTGKRVDVSVTFTDLAPTLARVLGDRQTCDQLRGRSLAPLMHHATLPDGDNEFVAETFSVADGLAYQRPVGKWRTDNGMPTDTIAGVASYGWFVNYILGVMDALNVGPDVVPIFLTDNVMLYDGTYDSCCTIGFHGTPAEAATTAKAKAAGAQQTLIYAAWSTPGTYSGYLTDYTGVRSAPSPTRGIADIHAFSHEVAEHLDDPFVNNAVTPWLTPTAPQYGCTPVLETGDPVVGVWFPLAGNKTGAQDGYQYYGQYHPEEEVFGQWYAHGAMEALGLHSWDGRLTFMGPRTTALGGPYADFGTYSHGC